MNRPLALTYPTRFAPHECIAVFPGNHDFYHHDLTAEAKLHAMTEAAGMIYAQKSAIFPHDAAIVRLVGALLLDQHEECAIQRTRYMTKPSHRWEMIALSAHDR